MIICSSFWTVITLHKICAVRIYHTISIFDGAHTFSMDEDIHAEEAHHPYGQECVVQDYLICASGCWWMYSSGSIIFYGQCHCYLDCILLLLYPDADEISLVCYHTAHPSPYCRKFIQGGNQVRTGTLEIAILGFWWEGIKQ